ncbi:MAG: phosphoenolpyruvate synthase [Bacteroidetes bacterium]|nr:phosphoenolpyruvate synthase [Bacteroidota bacterium]
MTSNFNKIEWNKYFFPETAFQLLMKRRIHKVLLICSNYDAFILDEGGRIDEQIFNEYVSLNLRYPPQFIHASNIDFAFQTLEEENIDLIITMLSTGDIAPFELSKKIKLKYPTKPIIVLTPFSRQISLKIDNQDLTFIDYIFSWLGDADILLAIVKLIEDKMNVDYDVNEIGVQVIILVEDSIRFYSSYLPNIYKIIFTQSKKYMTEGLNEHEQMSRMRGRPKILLATNYEEAVLLYNKYKQNLLGIISDINYDREGKPDKEAGFKLCKMVKKDDELLPFLLQSSGEHNREMAKKLRVGFINKNSKSISIELKDYIVKYFAFGDFVYLDPKTKRVVNRATDLQSFQQKIFEISDETLLYHIIRHHFSKWLNARALFPIADMFKDLKPEQFNNLDEIRRFIYDTIANYRHSKGRGVIAKFYKESFNKYLIFTRIGEGSLGGKARGLAFIESMLKRNNLIDLYSGILITIPRTVVLATDVFDEFMEENKLYDIALSNSSDSEILEQFVKAKLPFRIHEDLIAFLAVVTNPIAIRSSSLLEDSHYQPFAGIYSTYMIPNINDDKRLMIDLLSNSIKSVYASVYFKDSKAYMSATKNVIDEEKMGIVLQEVCGSKNGNSFFPTISGVARSLNFYPIHPEKQEDGIANIAFGLGKYIVDGGVNLRFSPKYPKKIIQLSSPKMALQSTQKEFYALDLSPESYKISTDDSINLKRLKVKNIKDNSQLKHIASTFDMDNNIIRDGVNYDGKKLITFTNILTHNTFPLANILNTLLKVGQKEMNNPIEIEFAVNLDVPEGKPKIFSFLQIRPIVESNESIEVNIDNTKLEDTIVISESALGNGIIKDIYDLVYVKPETFNAAKSREIAKHIEMINNKFLEADKNFILIGPGRWGSIDPWLGIPVKWPQISAARLIVESGLEKYRIDPSQGTHFFQNLTSFHVGYFTINPYVNDGFYDVDYLNKLDAEFENEFIRHIKFEKRLVIKIDGRKNRGVILKST